MSEYNQGSLIVGILWGEAALAILFTIARLYSRRLIESKHAWDDSFMIISLICNIISLGVITASVHYGLGTHQHLLTADNASRALMWQWIFQPLQVASNCTSRISVTILLVRLFPRQRAMKWTLIFLATMNTILGTVGASFIFAVCTPTHRLWDQEIPGHCYNPHIQANLAITKSTWSGFSDFITAVWPITIIWSLKMKTRAKAFLGSIFALTILAMVCCIVEDVYLGTNAVRTDETYLSGPLIIWIGTNVNILIIVGNVPALPPLFKHIFGTGNATGSGIEPSKWPSHQRGYVLSDNPRSRRDQLADGKLAFSDTIVGVGDRASSEEYILGNAKTGSHNKGIQMRTDITVDFRSTTGAD